MIKEIEKLSAHLKGRLTDLERMKAQGLKIVGYSVGGYMPEELVLACGAVPLCFIRSGDHAMVEMAGAYICRWFDTFTRSQIGLALSGEDPYYKMADLIVMPNTDNNIRALTDVLCIHTQKDIFPYGVPHQKDRYAFEYYLYGLNTLKKKLEELTGVEITDAKLREAIQLCNRERSLLREISLMRRSNPGIITGKDFVMLNHASFLADKPFLVEILESLCKELRKKPSVPIKGPKILLTGSTLAQGDTKVLDILDEVSANVVMEEFAEGIKPYWENVQLNGHLMEALADCYFMKRVCPGWFRPGKERFIFLVQLAKDFKVDGVIWYHLMYRESYKLESYYFPDILKRETGLSMLLLESDYDSSEVGQMRTRIETFIETLRR
jgi:benzoyl-CoA reductase/2-hydroxyglutaryl-CoA dehydratase subunit BcrC/BadD/HgdB